MSSSETQRTACSQLLQVCSHRSSPRPGRRLLLLLLLVLPPSTWRLSHLPGRGCQAVNASARFCCVATGWKLMTPLFSVLLELKKNVWDAGFRCWATVSLIAYLFTLFLL